jgi:hypothetical protein
MVIEEWFKVKVGSYRGKKGVGAYYRGLKDVEIRVGWKNKGVPFVSDHKSTKNFMWAKTAEDLTGGRFEVGDVQAGVYAYATMVELEQEGIATPIVDLQWTYMRTTGAPKSEPTIARINREQVDRIIAELELTTAEMIRTKDEHPTALTVVQDPTGCSAFGGCPYVDLCKLTPKEKMKAMMAQSKKESGVLGKLAARKAAKNGKSPPKKDGEKAPSSDAEAQEPAQHLSVVKDGEATDASVNPPENADAPVVTADDEEKKKPAKSSKKPATSRSKKAAASPVAATTESSSVLGRAVGAFWDVLVDDLATRIANKIGK